MIVIVICLYFRSIAPLVESVRCFMYFPFESYVIVPWLDDLAPPSHLLHFIVTFLELIKLMHIGSIALWLWVWYRQVRRNPQAAKAEILFAASAAHKATLIKEDKCIAAGVCANNINIINQRRPWQYALYLVTIIISLSVIWAAYTLRFEQCNNILKTQHVVEL